MASTILQRAEQFKILHDGPDLFVMPNPWDIGSARIMAGLGAKALATTSAGFAYTIGRRDGRGAVSRDEALAHSRAIVEATDLPVSADLENGYVDAPRDVAETIRLAAATGLAGASIEDATGDREAPIYDFGHAVERIAAASEAARSLSRPFTLTARAENLLFGIDDLDDTLKRLQAFQEVGADVLYAPGLRRIEDIKLVCDSLEKPVSLLMGLKGAGLTSG